MASSSPPTSKSAALNWIGSLLHTRSILLPLPLLLLLPLCSLWPAPRTGPAAAIAVKTPSIDNASGRAASLPMGRSSVTPEAVAADVAPGSVGSGNHFQPSKTLTAGGNGGEVSAIVRRGAATGRPTMNATAAAGVTAADATAHVHLPCLHTRAPPELGWPTMRCPSEGVVQLTDEYDQYKALHRTLVHKPLPGVNSTHIEWWFRRALPSTLVFRGRTWDAYKLWHPVDHVMFERTNVTDPRVGFEELNSSVTAAQPPATVPAVHIVEQFRGPCENSPLSSANSTAATDDIETASNVRTTVATVQAHDRCHPHADSRFVIYPLDATLVLSDTQPNMHRLLFYIGYTVMQELYHIWEDSAEGLIVTSKFILGGRTSSSAELNTVVLHEAFPQDRREAWVLHAVEEFGNMPFFLREIYEDQVRGAPLPPPLGRRR